MRKLLLSFWNVVVLLLLTTHVYAQTAEPQVLTLGNYDTPDSNQAWDGFNLQNAPVIFTYNYSGSQVLYQPDQLTALKGKQITSLSFKCFTEDCYVDTYNSKMTMYLQEIDQNEFTYNKDAECYEWVKFDPQNVIATKDFTADFMTAAIEYTDIEITFDLSANPYTYQGKTLIVTIVNETDLCLDQSNGSVRFYWIDNAPKDPWKSLVFASDNTDFMTNQQKDNLVKAADNEDKWKNAPVVKFSYIDAPEPEPSFSGGEGTQEAPYLISSIEDLKMMDQWTTDGKTAGVYFSLTQDLTAEPFTGIIGSTDNFKGHFDGNYHTILLDINLPEAQYVGLFGCIEGGSAKNLVVKGNVKGGFYVGGFAGQIANSTTAENIVNLCNVEGQYSVGGVIGQVITQELSAPCKVLSCANYGTVVGTDITGGLIGDMGQQVGNDIQRIANYGHVSCAKTAGGLIGNARPYDNVHFGLNVGTADAATVAGCIGNTQSSNIGNIHYDGQIFNTQYVNAAQILHTDSIVGAALKNNENGFSDQYWIYTDNMYPRLKMNGLENNPVCVLYATPIMLAKDDTRDNIRNPFTVCTDNGVVWTSKEGKVEIKGNQVKVLAEGKDVLVATLGDVTREIEINISDASGIRMTQDSENLVSVQPGQLVLDLSGDVDVQVYDMVGQMVAQNSYAAGHYMMNLSEGLYIVRLGNKAHKIYVPGN